MSATDLPSDCRTCAADLFNYHEPVLRRLASKNPSVDRDDLHDAFVKTILQIAAKPEKFDLSRKNTLEDFLVGASQRALLQILRTHRRRKQREKKKAAAVANDAPAARQAVDILSDSELASNAKAVAKTEEERNVLRLWQMGHADAEIAQHLSMSDDRTKRVRDRLTQRLRRLAKRFDDQEP